MENQVKNYITLAQFLKLSNWVQSGGQAKYACKELSITVNSEKEDRRGRKLYNGDVVIINEKKYVIKNEG
jgi:ribosome-associated protein YbcJ (S4-like RNA binding protein)